MKRKTIIILAVVGLVGYLGYRYYMKKKIASANAVKQTSPSSTVEA